MKNLWLLDSLILWGFWRQFSAIDPSNDYRDQDKRSIER